MNNLKCTCNCQNSAKGIAVLNNHMCNFLCPKKLKVTKKAIRLKDDKKSIVSN